MHHLNTILPHLGKHKIEQLKKVIDNHYVKRFKGKRKTPKYGTLNKGFTDEQLEVFFENIDSPKFKLLFSYQAYMGLRVGEAILVNLKEINQQTRELTINTEKGECKRVDSLLMPLKLYKQTMRYIKKFKPEIEQAQGYLFFKDKGYYSARKEAWIDKDYVRKRFTYYIGKAKLENQEYGISDELNERTPRKLHRLTTHSLRHYAITKFSKACNGNLILTGRFARHADPSVTMTYIATDKEQLYKEIDRAFG